MENARIRKTLLLIAGLLLLWAAVIALTGGVGTEIRGVRVSSRAPERPVWYALGVLVVYFIVARRHLAEDLAWARALPERHATPIAALAAVSSAALAVTWGVHTAGGADAYGYVSQADLWLRGQLTVPLPQPAALSGIRPFAFAPLGYRPGLTPGTIVPIYAPGLPMMMAVGKALAGPCGVYAVVPICSALLVWTTYGLGRLVSSRAVGAAAAILIAFSPAVLFQSMWPMSDVPVAAAWTAAMMWLMRGGTGRTLAGGLATALTILIRPNLVPLAAVGAAMILVDARRRRTPWRGAFQSLAIYSVAALPAIVFIAWLNTHLYGSPLSAGYTHLDALFKLSNLPFNAYHYTQRLLQTHTPLIVLALVPLAYRILGPPDRSQAATRTLLYGTIVVMFASYVFYGKFEEWWYLRFLLPAFPVLIIAMSATLGALLGRIAPMAAAGLGTIGVVVLAVTQLNFVANRELFVMWHVESRYQAMGRYIAEHTPPNAAIITVQHSGSARYYGGRITVRYDWFDRLDDTIAALRAAGYRPYLLLEDWESEDFNRRFSPKQRAPALSRHPIAESHAFLRVTLYDLDGPAGRSGPPDLIPIGNRNCARAETRVLP